MAATRPQEGVGITPAQWLGQELSCPDFPPGQLGQCHVQESRIKAGLETS
jgi:hypothetical protein